MTTRNLLTFALLLFTIQGAIGCDSDVHVESPNTGGSSSSSSAVSSSNGGGGHGGSASSSSGSASGGSAGEGGSAGGATGCDELAPIMLSAGTIADDDQNGKWSPGESATVNVSMTNTSNMDVSYPGIEMASNNPSVKTGMPYNALFLVPANQTSEVGVVFTADPSVVSGTVVTFVATLHNIMNVSCSSLPTFSMTATIE